MISAEEYVSHYILLTDQISLYDCLYEGVHPTLPPHIFSVQVKSETDYIKGQWGRVQNKIKET